MIDLNIIGVFFLVLADVLEVSGLLYAGLEPFRGI